MPSFFSKQSSLLSKYERILNSYTAKNIAFDPEDMQHNELVSECVQLLEEKLNELMLIDQKMTAGLAIGASAIALSWLLPFGLVAVTGFSYGFYQLGQRQQASREYSAALENLVDVSRWALGNVNNKPEAIKTSVAVRSMVNALAPLTSTKQLQSLIHPTMQATFIDQAETTWEPTGLFGNKEEMTELCYNVYGYDQGGVFAILKAIGYIIQQAFINLKNFFTGDQNDGPESVVLNQTI